MHSGPPRHLNRVEACFKYSWANKPAIQLAFPDSSYTPRESTFTRDWSPVHPSGALWVVNNNA